MICVRGTGRSRSGTCYSAGRRYAGRSRRDYTARMSQVAVVVVVPPGLEEGAGADRLARCVESVAASERKPDACVVACAGPAGDVVKSAVRRGPPGAKLVESPAAAGWAGAVNAGVAATSTPLVALCDGTDTWSGRKLAAQAAAFARPGLDLVGHRRETVRDGVRHVVSEFPAEEKWPPLVQALRRPRFEPGTALFRRAAWDRTGGLREGVDAWPDLLVRAQRTGVPSLLLELPLSEVAADPGDWPDPPPSLGDVRPERTLLLGHVRELSAGDLLGRAPESPDDAEALRAGLFWLHDDIDGCHRVAQAHEGHRQCDYWHALMHRREGDFGNSLYWFRRVGRHPIFEDLHAEAERILAEAVGRSSADFRQRLQRDGVWEPASFGDFVRSVADGKAGRTAADTARRIQMAEFRLLFAYTLTRAVKG